MKDFQEYIEPEEGCQGSPQRRGPLTSGTDEDGVALPLGDNVLTHNLGVPVLVVCTKVRPGDCPALLGLLSEQERLSDTLMEFLLKGDWAYSGFIRYTEMCLGRTYYHLMLLQT